MGTTVKVTTYPTCNLCGKEAHYDARTVYGSWAYMCNDHWLTVGCGRLGTGYGQRLVLS